MKSKMKRYTSFILKHLGRKNHPTQKFHFYPDTEGAIYSWWICWISGEIAVAHAPAVSVGVCSGPQSNKLEGAVN
jgi:hypothetical protein